MKILLNVMSGLVIFLLLSSSGEAARTGNRVSYLPEVKLSSADPRGPQIEIVSPDPQRSLKAVSKSETITVVGKVRDESGVASISVNGQPAALDEQGNFSADVLLRVGENRITVSAMNLRKKSSTHTFMIKREGGKVASPVISQTDNVTSLSVKKGSYYALLIAVQEYASPEINRLDHPLQDARALRDELVTHYTFDERNIIMLQNPDRKAISKAFNDLRQRLTEHDNLFIFYAGHGIWMEDMKEGYWLPKDASGINDPTDWIPNSTIRNYIRALKARHVLLVADACFSGGIFKVRDPFLNPAASIEKIYAMPSRRAITSGALKTVPDKSVFVLYLLKRLRENSETYLDAQKLFISFKEAVINNSPNNQTPLYGAIAEAGDEGGDFIFIRRN